MADFNIRSGARQPTNVLAATIHNSIAGPTVTHPTHFPAGTPVAPSQVSDHTVIPGRTDAASGRYIIGIAATPGFLGERVLIQTEGVITLSTAQWDLITKDVGGLLRGDPYWLASGASGHEGQMSSIPSTTPGHFNVRVGIALSSTDFLILPCCPKLVA